MEDGETVHAPVADNCAEPTCTGGVCGPAVAMISEALAAMRLVERSGEQRRLLPKAVAETRAAA